VKLEFAGAAQVTSRDNAKKVIIIEASGADRKGRGEAQALLTASLTPSGAGTKVNISLDLTISGAAAQFGRGLVADVTAVLVGQTANSMKARMKAIQMGLDPNSVGGPKAASGIQIGINVAKRAVGRIYSRLVMPYQPVARR